MLLALVSLTTGRYFLVETAINREVVLFANIDEQKRQKKMYRSLFIKDLLTAFLKDIKLLQFYIVPWESEAITK